MSHIWVTPKSVYSRDYFNVELNETENTFRGTSASSRTPPPTIPKNCCLHSRLTAYMNWCLLSSLCLYLEDRALRTERPLNSRGPEPFGRQQGFCLRGAHPPVLQLSNLTLCQPSALRAPQDDRELTLEVLLGIAVLPGDSWTHWPCPVAGPGESF